MHSSILFYPRIQGTILLDSSILALPELFRTFLHDLESNRLSKQSPWLVQHGSLLQLNTNWVERFAVTALWMVLTSITLTASGVMFSVICILTDNSCESQR